MNIRGVTHSWGKQIVGCFTYWSRPFQSSLQMHRHRRPRPLEPLVQLSLPTFLHLQIRQGNVRAFPYLFAFPFKVLSDKWIFYIAQYGCLFCSIKKNYHRWHCLCHAFPEMIQDLHSTANCPKIWNCQSWHMYSRSLRNSWYGYYRRCSHWFLVSCRVVLLT